MTSGLRIDGKCVAPFKCEGVSGQGAGGEGMQQISQMLGDLMKQLMQGGGGGGGGMGDLPTTTFEGGCVNYYQVTVPSSDPCALFVPTAVTDAAGGSSGISNNLLDALGGGGTPSSVSNTLLNPGKNTSSSTNTGSQSSSQGQPQTNTPPSNAFSLIPGLSGDVRIGSAGATIIANLREGLSEVAGFFGGSTLGASESLSVAGRLCASRPWAESFVTNLIPTSFFDGLCEWRGYQVGAVAAQGGPSNTSTSLSASSQSSVSLPPSAIQLPASDAPPEVNIWAEPASVRLGTRTYIFWNAKGVVSCKAVGPSFTQNSLSGGASTVPISGPTTFNIQCLTAASTTVSDSVTVQIAI